MDICLDRRLWWPPHEAVEIKYSQTTTSNTNIMTRFLRRNELSIDCRERVIYVFPLGDGYGAFPPSVVDGNVRLTLTKTTVIHEISIKLVGHSVARSQGRETNGDLIELSQTLLPAGKGPHHLSEERSFPFAFQLPASAPSSYRDYELGSMRYDIVAEAVGAGRFGADLIKSERLSVVSVLAPRGSPVPAMDAHYEDVVEGLGPISIRLHSTSVTLASLLSIDFTLVEAPNDVTLVDACVVITCQEKVRHIVDNRMLEEDFAQTTSSDRVLCRINGECVPDQQKPDIVQRPGGNATALAFVKGGNAYAFSHYARLPFGRGGSRADGMRGSTPEGSLAAVVVTHKISFRLAFDVEGSKRAMAFERPIEIGSCLLIESNVYAPKYEVVAAEETVTSNPRPFGPGWGSRTTERCACLMTYQECLESYHRLAPPMHSQYSAAEAKIDAGPEG